MFASLDNFTNTKVKLGDYQYRSFLNADLARAKKNQISYGANYLQCKI